MGSPARRSVLPAKGVAATSNSQTSSEGQNGLLDQLQALVGNGKVPKYVKLIVELLMETKNEVVSVNRRNADLEEEVRTLREENLELKQKLSHSKLVSTSKIAEGEELKRWRAAHGSRPSTPGGDAVTSPQEYNPGADTSIVSGRLPTELLLAPALTPNNL
ncbi:hypothetical protein ANCDUO_07466 [Ancylostoma duodenale]|uniref:Uncharacterized protein n=1 Tax=Ancylostoma duodenale TaxID=51022 RepID=A0A0C2DIF0_9BILA|nr:hypothetical protein ANCDUO_07466 [Ancylostoma duodenale]